jgi:hypothetical protein
MDDPAEERAGHVVNRPWSMVSFTWHVTREHVSLDTPSLFPRPERGQRAGGERIYPLTDANPRPHKERPAKSAGQAGQAEPGAGGREERAGG